MCKQNPMSTCVALAFSVLAVTSPAELRACPDHVLRVKAGTPSGDDGCSWDTAFDSLQDALYAAVANDQVWVASGTYVPGGVHGDSFQLKSYVAVYGGFAGTETSLGQRDPVANETILSGDVGGGVHRAVVVAASSVNQFAVLDGFTITGAAEHAISNVESSPTYANLLVVYNQASSYYGSGAGMYNVGDSDPSVTNCTFAWNAARWQGGAVYNEGGSDPSFDNCAFVANEAAFGHGGAVHGDNDCAPRFTNCIFENNRSEWDGGAICNYGGGPTRSLYLWNCTLSGNVARYSGGAVYCQGNSTDEPIKLVRCTFSGNASSGSNPGIMRDSHLFLDILVACE